MVFGMATTKITITLPNDQLKAIRDAVAAGKSGSISGFVQHAVKVALWDEAEYTRMLNEALERTGGPLTDQERAWADSFLSPKESKKTPRKREAA
jgi:Arc/MetJ-type ribon-helix-helix transcriptional regulator